MSSSVVPPTRPLMRHWGWRVVNQVDNLASMCGRIHAAVKPNQAEGTVVGEEFAELRLGFVFEILRKVLFGGIVIPVVAEAVGVVPIFAVRVVDAEANAGTATGFGKFFEGIALEGGPIDDVVFADLGVIHGEAVMMFGGDDHIFHAGGLGEGDPGFGVEMHGIELMGAFAIFGDGNVEALHDPFGFGVRGNLLALPFTGRERR